MPDAEAHTGQDACIEREEIEKKRTERELDKTRFVKRSRKRSRELSMRNRVERRGETQGGRKEEKMEGRKEGGKEERESRTFFDCMQRSESKNKYRCSVYQ